MSPKWFYKLLWIIVFLNVTSSYPFSREKKQLPPSLSASVSIIVEDSAAPSEKIIRTVNVITIAGVINPVSAEFILKSIETAEEEKVQCLVIKIDTPGGLMESMRDIVKGIMGADIPIVAYVAPSGARAASAGVFITMAAHIAIMAPGTNIGAAHPLMMGSVPGMPNDTTGTLMD